MTGFERKIEEGTKSKVVLEGTPYFFAKIFYILHKYRIKSHAELKRREFIYEFYKEKYPERDDWWMIGPLNKQKEDLALCRYIIEEYKKQVYGDGESPHYFYDREVYPNYIENAIERR